MNTRFIARIFALGFALTFIARVSLFANEFGSIRGTVSDTTGAVIAGVKLTATNVATNISVSATSKADGSYEFLQVQTPGTYKVTSTQAGFKTFEANDLHLGLNQIFVLNITLELGAVSQQVTVEAAPVQVEKTSIESGGTLTASQLVDIPLNGRNWVQLQQTLPGVVATADGRGNFATNGSQPDQNSFLINGIDSNDLPLNTALVVPSPDSIAEVRMITNTINPEYGRNSGAIMDAVTKSGANQFHGDGFEFFRDTSLNTRNFFSPSSVIFHQNQFGGTIGGPIKKDHTFFFFSYQGTRNVAPEAGGNTKVFTADQRNGIFSDVATSSALSPTPMTGESGTIYPAGTPYSTLFPTGHIPSADFNPLATKLLTNFVPLPTTGSQYEFNPTTTNKDDQYLGRIDENLSSKDALWGSWHWERHPDLNVLPFTGANLPGFPSTDQRHIQNYSMTWNHTFNASTLNEARVGYTRFNFGAVLPVNVLTPSSVGFTGITPQNPALSSYPVISLTGYFTLGFSTNGPQPRIDQTAQADDNFTKILGRHTFKMGFDMRRFQVYNPFANSLSGHYTYGGSGVYSTGDPAADFLLGIPDSYSQGGGDIINARGQEYYTYFQDQFKIRHNLTLTYGTGWQIDTPTIDNYHSDHAMTAFRPGVTSTVFPGAPTGEVFQGDPGVNATGTTKYDHFGPRLGFAWSPGDSGKWSVRGGYGIYFNRELEEQTLQFLSAPPFSLTATGASACGGSPSFANPFMDIASGALCPNPFPVPSNPSSNVNFGPYLPEFLYAVDPNTSVPYSQNFNLTVQRQLTPSTIASIAYVGELGRREVILQDLNPGLNPAGCLAGIGAEAGCVANRVIQQIVTPQNFKYGPNLWGIGNNQTTGISNYNALQMTLAKHMSHGLAFNAVYTWSHAMDNGSGFENSGFGGGGFGAFGNARATNPFNQTLYNYGSSEFDATNRFVITYTYQIPSIHHFDNWAAKRIFSGWELSGVTTLQSGFPLDVVDTGFRSLTCSALNWTVCWDVPNEIAAPQYLNPRTSSNSDWFNPNTFAPEAFGTFGNAGRNPLRGPGIANFDTGLYKDTQITESTRMELRFEFYNVFNHTQFSTSNMSTDINAGSAFGQIVAAQSPRLIQLAAKFFF